MCFKKKIYVLFHYLNFYISDAAETVEIMDAPTIGLTLYSDLSKGLGKTLMFLFRLAWFSKIRLPAYLTFIFLAADIRLSIEIVVGEQQIQDVPEEEI